MMTDKNKKIVFFGSQITIGGAQRILLDQALWFHEQGYEVNVVFFYDKDGLLENWQNIYPFPIQTLSTFQRNDGMIQNLGRICKGFSKLVSFLRSQKPDVLETFTHDADIIGLPAALLSRVPCRIGTHHGQFAALSKSEKMLHTWIINSRITTKLVCVSKRAENQALSEGVHKEKISVIYNGIHPIQIDKHTREVTRISLQILPTEIMILSVGRLVPEKAQLLLIKAAAIVRRTNPSAKFFIAGDGPMKEALQNAIQNEGLTSHFVLLGSRDDIPALLNAADIFVLFSKTEGMPVSLMEAMSAGLPIVASDLEGIHTLIPSEQYGRLLPFGNAEKLADTILKTINEKELSAQQGRNCITRVKENFSIDESCKKYEKLFFSKAE